MREIVYQSGEFLPAAKAQIAAVSAAGLYGMGVFTTVAVADAKPFLWEKHWQRLCHDASKLNIDISEHSETGLRDLLRGLIEKNAVTDGIARITFFDESPGGLWRFEAWRKTGLLITAAGNRKPPENLRLTLSPFRTNSASPLTGVKSCNYLENLLALGEAKSRGFDEAVRLNEHGHISSACLANIFWLRNDRLYTPKLETGCLAGTTREFIMENLACEAVEAGSDALDTADAIYLTSAGIGIVQAARFGHRDLPPVEHPLNQLLSLITI